MSLHVDPRIPLALWWPLAALAAMLLAVYAVSARGRLARGRWAMVVGMMGLVLAVPLVVLLNPTWSRRLPPPEGKPLLTVLVDRSASMAVADLPGGQRRFDVAARVAIELARSLADRFELRLRVFADDWAAAASPSLEGVAPTAPRPTWRRPSNNRSTKLVFRARPSSC